jgi:hypothetical protein
MLLVMAVNTKRGFEILKTYLEFFRDAARCSLGYT